MHPYLLNLIYATLLIILSPWLLLQAVSKNKYRRGWGEKLFGCNLSKFDRRPCVWFHAVSVGEVNLLQPILQRLQAQHPTARVVISATTRSGYELAKLKYADLDVFYAPLDFSWAVKNTLNRLRPELLVLAELEIWPNLIRECRMRSIKVAVVNGRLSEHSQRGYRRVKSLLAPVFASLDFVGAQNQEYADRFLDLGVREQSLRITGSVKFDGAIADRNNDRTNKLARLAGIRPTDIVFLAGSTQEPEEEYALETFQELQFGYPHLKLLIVPRHPERFDAVARLLNESGVKWQRRSLLTKQGTSTVDASGIRVLLIDTIGELGAWWGTADIAFVGGSFGSRGGQNMIEPAAYGTAVCFGPNTQNFRDVVSQLLLAKAAEVVIDRSEMLAFVRRCLSDAEFAATLGDRARQLVLNHQGAADQTVAELLGLLGWVPATSVSEKVA